jgi:Amt family ammonium transporter
MALIYRSAWIALCVAICWERACAESVNPETIETSAPPPAAVEVDKADIAWVLCSTALVLSMTAPGLALFYGGLVRKKNILGVMMQCISLMGVMSVVWALWGYSLAFSGDNFGLIGDFGYFGMNGVLPEIGKEIPKEGTLPKTLHMLFQMMFFMITPGLICGAYAERMKFSSMLLFSVLWGTFIYCPVAHWVWSSAGWCAELNEHAAYRAIDFAGGTVVHVTSGVSALICALFVGKRLGHGHEPMPPHNLTYTCIGTGLLWMGWFGFNGGSALAADARAANACLTTHLAAATGVMMWAGLEWILRGKPSILGACSGAIAGLVCITPACGSVSATSAMILGAAGGAVCFYACTTVKNHFQYDDSLDAFGVHGVGGSLGAILTGVFATRAVTGEKGLHGLIEGDAGQVVSQFAALGASAVWAIVGTVTLLKLIDAAIGLRVTQAGELQGLDIQEHGEEGYIFL